MASGRCGGFENIRAFWLSLQLFSTSDLERVSAPAERIHMPLVEAAVFGLGCFILLLYTVDIR